MLHARNAVLGIFLAALLCCAPRVSAEICKGEKIVYAISPVGTAEYNDLGLVDYQGEELWLVTFRTKVPGFSDLEKIYADPKTELPLRVERYIRWPLSQEFIVEEYDPRHNAQVTRRYIKNKLTNEYKYKSNAPFHNAILLPFVLREKKNLRIGWNMKVRVPEEFTVTFDRLEEVKAQGKTYKACHFSSKPDQFEIWISDDKERLPVVIKGKSYSMYLQSHSK